MTPLDSPVRLLGADELDSARTALARAFDEDPLFRFLLPKPAQRERWLHVIMAGTLAQTLPDQHVFVPAQLGDGASVGVMAVVPPDAYPLPSARDWRFLLQRRHRPALPFPPFRLLRSGLGALRLINKHHYDGRHYYLQTMGVDPAYKGQGVGRLLLEHLCALADRDGVPAYLETSNEVNLGFYRRFGFEERDRFDTPGGGPPIWTMVRV